MKNNKLHSYCIDLKDYQTKDSRVFSGRDRGREVREKSKIDEKEIEYDYIQIIIPENIRSINPSFLEEFIQNVVIKLKSRFEQKFSFICEGRYDIKPDVDDAIENILKEKSALN